MSRELPLFFVGVALFVVGVVSSPDGAYSLTLEGQWSNGLLFFGGVLGAWALGHEAGRQGEERRRRAGDRERG